MHSLTHVFACKVKLSTVIPMGIALQLI